MAQTQMLDLLTREGVLLNVSVRYWRAAKKLQAQDLGLDPDDVTDHLISLGTNSHHPVISRLPGQSQSALTRAADFERLCDIINW